MKKIYLQPETLVEGMELEEMIASSLTTDSSGNISQDLSTAGTTTEVSNNLSRELFFFSVFE